MTDTQKAFVIASIRVHAEDVKKVKEEAKEKQNQWNKEHGYLNDDEKTYKFKPKVRKEW